MKIYKILFILGIMAILAVAILSLIFPQEHNQKIKCYDKYSNEIIGSTCIHDGFSEDNTNILISLFLLGFILETFATCLYAMEDWD
jgi:hypothetical protein